MGVQSYTRHGCDKKNEERKAKPRVQGCLVCEHTLSVVFGRKHTIASTQTDRPTSATESLWTVRFDADVNSLKRTDVDDARKMET